MEEIQKQLEEIKSLSLLAAKKILSIEDAAALTGLSKSHLYHLTRERKIPHYKPQGKVIYFDRAELEAWMKQNRVNSTAEANQMAAAYNLNGKTSNGQNGPADAAINHAPAKGRK